MNNWANNNYHQRPNIPMYSYGNTGIIWVQDEENAKAYPLQPNTNAVLLDSETDGRMYIKSVDSFGMQTLYVEMAKLWLNDVDSAGGDIKTYRYATKV